MRVSLATIAVAYHVHTGTPMAADMAFYDAGRKVEKELGMRRAHQLFEACAAVVAVNSYPTTYEAMAQQVIANRTNA